MMLPSRGLRSVEHGMNNARRVLGKGRRNYSIHTSQSRLLRATRYVPARTQSNIQHARSLSFWGWGGSSNPSTPTGQDSVVPQDTNSPSLDNVRAIKASHATSDSPDPSLHVPNKIEPEFLEKAQQALVLPHGDSTRAEDILNEDIDISAAPEGLGYLRDVCGLDFGWGPTASMEWCLEHLHISAGLGWTASIIVLSVGLRLAMVPSLITSQQQTAKMKAIQPIIKPLRAQYTDFMGSGQKQKAAQVAQEIRVITREGGVRYSRIIIPLLIQFPFQYGAFRLLRAAGNLPVPGFVTANWLWTKDLSFSDPYFLTPMISSGCMYFQFKMQQKATAGNSTPISPEALKVIGLLLPGVSFLFMAFQPGSVQLYFMASSILAFATAAALRQPVVRRIANLGPLDGGAPIHRTSSNSAVGATSSSVMSASKTTTSAVGSAPPTYPGGMRPIQARPSKVDATVVAGNDGVGNRSLIDRMVDKIKASGAETTKTFRDGLDTASKSLASSNAVQKQAQQKAAKYEQDRRRELEIDRERRNQKARGD